MVDHLLLLLTGERNQTAESVDQIYLSF